MATGMFGANVEELIQIGRDFETTAQLSRDAADTVSQAIESVEWIGVDAQRYRDTWGQSLPDALNQLADLEWDVDDRLRQQAEDQDDASKPGDDKGCLEKTGDFFGGVFSAIGGFFKGLIVDGLWGDIKDMLGLIGMNFDDGFSWSLDNALENWGGMLSGLAGLIGLDTNTWSFSWETAGNAWGGMLGDFVAWDMWATDPAAAFGKVVWNVGSLFIPGYNIAKVFKILRRADVPDAPHVDTTPDTPNGDRAPDGGDRTPDQGRSPDSDGHTPNAGYNGVPERLPENFSVNPRDGSVRTPDGQRFDVEHQRTNIDPASTDLNRDVTRPGSLEPETMYTTTDGQVFTTDRYGNVEYAAVSRTHSELVPSHHDNMGPATESYHDHDPGDERGHHLPSTHVPENRTINLDQQSPGANRGVDRGASSTSPGTHQQLLEGRTVTYMRDHPEANVTWERRTTRDYTGTPETNPNWGHATQYQVRVSHASGPVNLDTAGRPNPQVGAPGQGGWYTIDD